MVRGALGRIYEDGEYIIEQGKTGDSMFVVQGGRVEVIQTSKKGREQHLAFLESGDFFGEMAVFEKEVRSATVRAAGEARVLKIDKRALMTRIQEDPLLAINLLKTMSHRIRKLDDEIARHKKTHL